MSERPHGYARYSLDGCRCYTCAWARAQYNDRREKLIRLGQWRPFVDPAPALAHIAALRGVGLGLRQIAALAGLNRKALQELVNGSKTKIRPPTHAALLAVPLDAPLPDKAVVDGTGTRRMAQALFAMGWTFKLQAEERGQTLANQAGLARSPRVIAATHRDMVRLYTAWSTSAPPDTWQAGKARKHALRQQWFGPGAWDEGTIDDPAALPCLLPATGEPDPLVDELLIQQFIAGFDVRLPWRGKVEVVHRMRDTPPAEIAELLQVGVQSISTMRSMHVSRRSEVAA